MIGNTPMKYGNNRTPNDIMLILAILACIVVAGCSPKTLSQLEREKRMQNSAQFKEGKFVNPIDVPMMAEGSTWKYIKKAYFSKRIDPKPAGKLPMKPIQPNDWLKTNKETI